MFCYLYYFPWRFSYELDYGPFNVGLGGRFQMKPSELTKVSIPLRPLPMKSQVIIGNPLILLQIFGDRLSFSRIWNLSIILEKKWLKQEKAQDDKNLSGKHEANRPEWPAHIEAMYCSCRGTGQQTWQGVAYQNQWKKLPMARIRRKHIPQKQACIHYPMVPDEAWIITKLPLHKLKKDWGHKKNKKLDAESAI